jgi:hypothetical protein
LGRANGCAAATSFMTKEMKMLLSVFVNRKNEQMKVTADKSHGSNELSHTDTLSQRKK